MWENILQYSEHIITSLIIVILAKLLPNSQKREHEKHYDLQTLEKQYQRYDLLSFIAICVFAPMVLILFYFFLEFITNLINSQNSQSFIPPINIPLGENNIAICTCLFFTFWLSLGNIFLKTAMGLDKFEMYGIYGEMKHGIDSQKAEKWWIGLFGVVSIVFLFYSNDWYIKFYEDKIEYNTFISLKSNTYSYSDIDSIKFVIRPPREPVFNGDKSFRVKFKDKNDWNSNWGMDGKVNQNEIINFVSQKSKIQIDTVIER